MRNPLFAAAMVAFLLALASRADYSIPGVMERKHLRVHHTLGPDEIYVLKTSSGDLQLIDPDVASWDKLSRAVSEHPEDLLRFKYVSTVRPHGWWYPAVESGTRRIQVDAMSPWPAFSDRERSRAMEMYLQWAVQQFGHDEITRELTSGPESVDRIIWPNLVLDVSSAAVVGLLAFSVAGMPRYLRVATSERRLTRGKCGVCRYDLRSIERTEAGVRCPECGAVWP